MTDAAAFSRQTAALLAARSEHLPAVLDVTSLGSTHELMLAKTTGPTLADLIARRRRLTTAEAVTVTVSVARAAAALHAAGYCGIGLADDEIRFDGDSRPVVVGLTHVRETIHTGAEGTTEDWRSVTALAERLGLLAHGRAAGPLGPAHTGVSLALATLTAVESDAHVAQLEDALFDLAEPLPVRLDDAPDSAAQPIPDYGAPARSPSPRRSAAAHRRPSASAVIEAFDAGPAALIAGPLKRLRVIAAAARGRLTGRARLVTVAAGGAAALTAGAVMLLPSETRVHGHPTASVSPAFEPRRPTATADLRLMAEDPVAAAAILLARRDACLAEGASAGAGCLKGVADGDTAAVERPARPLAGLTPSLLERTGDSALIALTPSDDKTDPASALLMRTEAGWKLRELYDG